MTEEQLDRTFRNLDRVDEINAELDAGAELRREAVLEERHQERLWERQERQRAAEQPQTEPWFSSVAVRAPERDWAAERKWIERIVAGKLEAFAAGLGQEVAKIEREQLARLRREVEERIAKSDSATVELLMDLERRVAELERRAVSPKPRLVGGSNAA